MAGGEGLTPPDAPDHYRVLQVHREACSEVIEAAFTVLREKLIREDGDDAARRLAQLNAAHLTLSRADLRRVYDADRASRVTR